MPSNPQKKYSNLTFSTNHQHQQISIFQNIKKLKMETEQVQMIGNTDLEVKLKKGKENGIVPS